MVFIDLSGPFSVKQYLEVLFKEGVLSINKYHQIMLVEVDTSSLPCYKLHSFNEPTKL